MTDLILPATLTEEIRRLAEWNGLTPEEVMTQAVRQYSARARQQKIQAESAWWTNAPAELRAQYAGQYVAVHQQQVIDHDPHQLTLYRRVFGRWGHIPVLVAPAEIPELRLISTHLEKL